MLYNFSEIHIFVKRFFSLREFVNFNILFPIFYSKLGFRYKTEKNQIFVFEGIKREAQ